MRTELGRSQVEVQQCALSWEVGEELGEELARRKWRWKLMQTWSRRNWRRRRRRRRRSRRRRRRRRRTTALIKSNNPHLAGGEKIGCMPMYAIEWYFCLLFHVTYLKTGFYGKICGRAGEPRVFTGPIWMGIRVSKILAFTPKRIFNTIYMCIYIYMYILFVLVNLGN